MLRYAHTVLMEERLGLATSLGQDYADPTPESLIGVDIEAAQAWARDTLINERNTYRNRIMKYENEKLTEINEILSFAGPFSEIEMAEGGFTLEELEVVQGMQRKHMRSAQNGINAVFSLQNRDKGNSKGKLT